VLLVEDNDMNQELAVELLSRAGLLVVVANNGQEALDILARDRDFDGVLMDCQMPVMDGYSATREIRASPLLRHLPVLAMTANAMASDQQKVLDAGMNDHIAKPSTWGDVCHHGQMDTARRLPGPGEPGAAGCPRDGLCRRCRRPCPGRHRRRAGPGPG
jgi:CheY-like chemotaxis protein